MIHRTCLDVVCLYCGQITVMNESNSARYTFDNPDYNIYRTLCERGCGRANFVFAIELHADCAQLESMVATMHVSEPPDALMDAFKRLHGYRPLDRRELNIDESVEAEQLRRLMADGTKWEDLLAEWMSETG